MVWRGGEVSRGVVVCARGARKELCAVRLAVFALSVFYAGVPIGTHSTP